MSQLVFDPEAPAAIGGCFMNGQGFGSIAQKLLRHGMDPNVLRPYFGTTERTKDMSFITRPVVNKRTGKTEMRAVPVNNANTLLRKDEWIKMDDTVLKVARNRLRLWNDLVGSGATYSIADGMGVLTLQHQTQSDITDAEIGMTGLSRSKRDRPDYGLVSTPVPLLFKDFNFGLREILASRRGNTPLDLTMVEQATRKVVELVEKLVAGTQTFTHSAGALYGSGTIQGYTSFSSRLTATITSPTSTGWTPDVLIDELLNGVLSLSNVNQFGPFMMYHSPNWDRFMGADYSRAKGDNTLRSRIKQLDNITDVRRSDYMSNYDIVLVALGDPSTAQAVTAVGLQVVQWETEGGMEVHYKVLGSMFPRLRTTYTPAGTASTGLWHASTA